MRDNSQPINALGRQTAALFGAGGFNRWAEEGRRMTRPAVYLETSVVGYATTRPSRDLVVAGHQQVTREWYALRATRYELFISQLVASEASGGDEEAAQDALHIAIAAVHGVDYSRSISEVLIALNGTRYRMQCHA
jgi:hypothetical protein